MAEPVRSLAEAVEEGHIGQIGNPGGLRPGSRLPQREAAESVRQGKPKQQTGFIYRAPAANGPGLKGACFQIRPVGEK